MPTRTLSWIVALIVVILWSSLALAAARLAPIVPKIIVTGMGAYAFQGADAAVKAWVRGTHMEGTQDASTQANSLKQIESLYGDYQGYQVIRMYYLTQNSMIVYLSINYERGAAFGRFLAYRLKDEWILPDFKFSPQPEAVFPAELFVD